MAGKHGMSKAPRIYLNPLPQFDNATWIELTQGYYALLDSKMISLNIPGFCVQKLSKTYYGARYEKKDGGGFYYLYLHRWVLEQNGIYASNQIDHINGHGWDNRLCNLRLATVSQNKGNVQLYSNNTSGHKGVSWDEERGKWKASLHMIVAGKNKTKFLGRFYDKILAARAYDRAAIKHFGKFAFTNFPLTDYLTPEEINEIMSK